MHPYGSCGRLLYGKRMVWSVPRFCGLVSWSPSLAFWLDILSLGARAKRGSEAGERSVRASEAKCSRGSEASGGAKRSRLN